MSYYGTSPLSPSSDYLTPASASTSYYTPTSAFPSSHTHSRSNSKIVTSPLSAPPHAIPPVSLKTRWELSPHGNVSEIIPGLLISDLSIAEDAESLSELGVTHVLSVMPGKVNVPLSVGWGEGKEGGGKRIEHLQVPIYDNPFEELVAHLPQTTQWICEALHPHPHPQSQSYSHQHNHSHQHSRQLQRAQTHPHRTTQNKVLVHCALGRSRSVSVVCAYLIHSHGYGPDEALEMVKRLRTVAQPNSGFVGQLGEWARGMTV